MKVLVEWWLEATQYVQELVVRELCLEHQWNFRTAFVVVA